MTGSPLRLSEGVELGYALVDHLAMRAGARSLAIKGPVLARHGLRRPRTSADVDALVEPDAHERVGKALGAAGWVPLVVGSPHLMPPHSTTYRHPGWPCTIDLHHYFPGFLAPAGVVFDALWDRRAEVMLAERAIACADPIGQAAIAALHYLRDEGSGRRAGDLADLADRVRSSWDDGQRADLSELAGRIGAGRSLAPFLDAIGAPSTGTTLMDDEHDEVWLTWRLRSGAAQTTALAWVLHLRRLPWHRRPFALLEAVWSIAPGSPDWRGLDPSSTSHRLLARVRRLRRGLRAIPTALADLRRLRWPS